VRSDYRKIEEWGSCYTELVTERPPTPTPGYSCAEWIDPQFGSTPCFSEPTNHKREGQVESWGSRYPFLGRRVALRVSVAPFVAVD
jgi:hypothetical protein